MTFTKLVNPDYTQGDEDLIIGTSNDDTLEGFVTNDTIIGDDGDDVINGDTGTQNNDDLNNSYEIHGDFNRGGWGLFEEVDGWHYEGDHLIELQASGTVGTASQGDTVLELDSTGNSTVYRDIENLNPELTHELSFDFSARPGVAASSNTIQVYWDGVLLDTITADGIGLTDFNWTTYTYSVPVTDSDARLTFVSVGDEDSLGGMIDNVGLVGEMPAFDPLTEGGDDLLNGGAGDDIINGGAGNDVIIGGEGADTIDGGAGSRDTVSFEESDGRVYVNLTRGIGKWNDAAGDTYTNVEYVHGSQFNDRIIGDSGVNRLSGHDGDDNISGGGGNDILIGGWGADKLNGGSGSRDVADYSWATDGVDVNLETGVGTGNQAEGDTLTNIEYLYGSFFDDILTGDDGVNRLVGNYGDDQLFGGDGNDILVGGDGADALNGGEGTRDAADYGDALTGVGVDLSGVGFAGEATGDTFEGIEFVYGSDFGDDITGDDQINRLVGAEGDDTLDGAGGNDYLLGEEGNDVMTGGAGDDVFVFEAEFGDDQITDFEAGAGRTDRLWIDDLGFTQMSDLTITDTAEGALIDVGDYGTILLVDVLASDLVEDDFIF